MQSPWPAFRKWTIVKVHEYIKIRFEIAVTCGDFELKCYSPNIFVGLQGTKIG